MNPDQIHAYYREVTDICADAFDLDVLDAKLLFFTLEEYELDGLPRTFEFVLDGVAAAHWRLRRDPDQTPWTVRLADYRPRYGSRPPMHDQTRQRLADAWAHHVTALP